MPTGNLPEADTCLLKWVKLIRYRQSLIIEIERSINDTNVIVFNEDKQFEVLFRPLAMGIVAEAIYLTAEKAADAKKASGPLVIRLRMRFRSR